MADSDLTEKSGDLLYRPRGSQTSRLINWNVNLLKGCLQQIVAYRNANMNQERGSSRALQQDSRSPGTTVIDEVCEIIELPEFDSALFKRQENPDSIALPDAVVEQLEDFVAALADAYKHNVRSKERTWTRSCSSPANLTFPPSAMLDFSSPFITSSMRAM